LRENVLGSGGPGNLTDRRPVIFAEIGNRFVIRNKSAGEPHDLNVAPALTLKPTARLNSIEITIDVEFEQRRRMIRGPAGCLGVNSAKLQFGQIELLNKGIDDANRIILANPIFQAFKKKRALPAIYASTKRFI
jgi:hypothetical protein